MGVISLVAMFKLNAFQRDLLVGLAKTGKTSGSDLRTYLRDATDHDEITHSRLYPNLNQLVTDGFVEKGAIDQRTNSYELSEKGEKARKEHTEWVTA